MMIIIIIIYEYPINNILSSCLLLVQQPKVGLLEGSVISSGYAFTISSRSGLPLAATISSLTLLYFLFALSKSSFTSSF
eukprot:gnl/Chilomastix_caulleri/8139.p1 GENE.gnl/Chilomastix_caulleri/8139~~gnl/Chilomastix_caulleri/8139.p1  ORF type:complete len:79 (-),score=16.22 gnl/Chilomastix_caulleri/8139:56-292(-)